MALPLNARKNIKEYDAERDALVGKIKASTGQAYAFEVDPAAIYSVVDEKDRIGEIIVHSYFRPFAEAVVKLAADSMSKEAFVEATTGRKVVMKVGGEDVNWRGEVKFEGGNVVLLLPAKPQPMDSDEVFSADAISKLL